MEQTHALGRRKAAVARVYIVAGKGNITINDRTLDEYFKEDALRYLVNQPLNVTGTEGQFDIKVTINGGGTKGHAGFLTRDAREVERKKPGQPGARRRFQFSKR